MASPFNPYSHLYCADSRAIVVHNNYFLKWFLIPIRFWRDGTYFIGIR